MKIAIFGGLGYIGSTLVSKLAEDNEIIIADNAHYEFDETWFKQMKANDHVEIKIMDVQNDSEVIDVIDRADKIVNLSALVGPICNKDELMAKSVNYDSACNISNYCEEQKKHMIFLSTCSNYGMSKTLCNEESELNPLTLYSQTKVGAEKHIMRTNPYATILRMSTVFGVSRSRTRMDIIPNQFLKEAIQTQKIEIYEPKAIRPIIHVKDACNVIKMMLNSKPKHQVYNVGFPKMNLTKEQMCKNVTMLVSAVMDEVESTDTRTYEVDFSRLHNEFQIEQEYGVARGLKELLFEIKFNDLELECGNY